MAAALTLLAGCAGQAGSVSKAGHGWLAPHRSLPGTPAAETTPVDYPTAGPASAAALAAGHWVHLPPAPIDARGGAASAWTGRDLLGVGRGERG